MEDDGRIWDSTSYIPHVITISQGSCSLVSFMISTANYLATSYNALVSFMVSLKLSKNWKKQKSLQAYLKEKPSGIIFTILLNPTNSSVQMGGFICLWTIRYDTSSSYILYSISSNSILSLGSTSNHESRSTLDECQSMLVFGEVFISFSDGCRWMIVECWLSWSFSFES